MCEVLSPNTALRDPTIKKALYEQQGIRHLWLVDPFHRTLEVLRLESHRWVPAGVFGGHEKTRMEPFQEIEIDLGIFGWRPGKPMEGSLRFDYLLYPGSSMVEQLLPDPQFLVVQEGPAA